MPKLRPTTPLRIATLVAVLAAAAVVAPAGQAATARSGHLYAIGHVGSGVELLPFDVAADGSLVEREDLAYPLPDGTDGTVAVGRDARTVYVGLPDTTDLYTSDPVPGAIDVLHVADDGSLSLVQTVRANPNAIAITADGGRLFTTTTGNDIVSFPIADDGTLGSESAPQSVAGSDVLSLTIAPTGPTLYAGTYDDTVLAYALAADGSLSPVGAPLALPCNGTFTAAAPDGDALDIFCNGAQDAYSYPIASDGTIDAGAAPATSGAGAFAALAGGSALAAWPFGGVALDPSGAVTVATVGALARYPLATGGALDATPTSTLSTWADFVQHLVYAPDQAPVAAASASTSALTATFDAGASHAVTGQIARYDWDFGDGTTATDAGPAQVHTYATAGTYTATVTLTDSAGCSRASTYSGAGTLCAGSVAARVSTTVQVAPAPVVPVLTLPVQSPTAVAPIPPATVTPVVTSLPAGGPKPATTTTTLVLDRLALHLHGTALQLSWRASAGVTRYLVVWTTRASARAKPVVHRSSTTTATLRLPRTTPHTVAVKLSAYGSRGKLLGTVSRTVRLTR